MLENSDFPAADALKLLQPLGIEAALLVPTSTGLEKSILDATDGLREYLSRIDYHDYKSQPLGRGGKIQREAFLVRRNSMERTTVSMYRPASKSGDPRIWPGKGVRNYVKALNMLAVTVLDGTMYVLNMSDPTVRESLNDSSSPFRRIVDKLIKSNADAEYLSQRMPLAERLVQDPTNGFFKVIYKEISKPDLLGATLSQVLDAIEDVLANASNGLSENSLDIRKLRRTLERYANDPQRVEMDFTTVHRSLTVQIGTEVLPASDEIQSLLSALQEGAQGIRATDNIVAENRRILQEQAIRELSPDALSKIAEAAPVLEAITEGELQGQMQEDVLFLTQEMRPGLPPLPGVTRADAIISGHDEAVRVLGRSARMLIAIRKSPSIANKIHESTAFRIADIASTLLTLINIGIALF